MTKEEADFIGAMNMCDEISNEAYKKIMCHCEEQEPCEDAVSRELKIGDEIYIRANVNEIRKDYIICENAGGYFGTVREEIKSSVTPTQKKGKWEQYGNYWEDKFKCSECGKEQPKILCGERIIGHWSDYCPNCGAKMEVEE